MAARWFGRLMPRSVQTHGRSQEPSHLFTIKHMHQYSGQGVLHDRTRGMAWKTWIHTTNRSRGLGGATMLLGTGSWFEPEWRHKDGLKWGLESEDGLKVQKIYSKLETGKRELEGSNYLKKQVRRLIPEDEGTGTAIPLRLTSPQQRSKNVCLEVQGKLWSPVQIKTALKMCKFQFWRNQMNIFM